MLTYSRRKNLFEKAERVFRIEDRALVQTDHKGVETRYPWDQVKSVRVTYTPTSNTPFRHVTILKLKDGKKAEFDNVHFAGLATFEDRTDTYGPFARAVLAKVAEFSPHAEAHQGATPAGYIGLIVLLVSIFLVLGLALLIAPIEGIAGTAVVKILLLLIFLPMIWLWVKKARPRGMKLADIPPDAIPGG